MCARSSKKSQTCMTPINARPCMTLALLIVQTYILGFDSSNSLYLRVRNITVMLYKAYFRTFVRADSWRDIGHRYVRLSCSLSAYDTHYTSYVRNTYRASQPHSLKPVVYHIPRIPYSSYVLGGTYCGHNAIQSRLSAVLLICLLYTSDAADE